MKFAIFVLFAVLGFSWAYSFDLDTLENDIKDFEPLIPKMSLGLIVAKHLFFDADFRKAKAFIGSDESKGLLLNIMKSQPFRDLVDDLKKKNIDVPEIINMLAAKANFPYYPQNFEEDILVQPRTLNNFIDEVVDALPRAKFANLMQKKVQTSLVFRNLLEVTSSSDYNKRIEAILNYPTLRPTFAKFNSEKIDFRHIHEAVKIILSWGTWSLDIA